MGKGSEDERAGARWGGARGEGGGGEGRSGEGRGNGVRVSGKTGPSDAGGEPKGAEGRMLMAWVGHSHLEVFADAVGNADGGALGAGDLARDLVLGVARDAGAVDFEDDVIDRLPAARRDGER